MECNGMDGRGLPAPKSDDSLVPLSIGTSWHTTATTPASIAAPFSFFLLPRGRTKEGKLQNGAVKAREVDRKPPPRKYCVAVARPTASAASLTLKLARGWDSFTCIPASTTKSSGLNAPTKAVQPFLGFVESGFPFTHNGGAAPTNQAGGHGS